MTYYIDLNDGAGPKPVTNRFLADAIVDHLVKKFKYRYRMRDVAVTIIEKVV